VDGQSPQSPRLSPRQSHLNVPPVPSESEASSEASGEVKRRRLTVVRGDSGMGELLAVVGKVNAVAVLDGQMESNTNQEWKT